MSSSREQCKTDPTHPRNSGGLTNEAHAAAAGDKSLDGHIHKDAIDGKESDRLHWESLSCCNTFLAVFLSCCPLSFKCNRFHSHEQSSEWQMSDEGMFFCSLCEVEVCNLHQMLMMMMYWDRKTCHPLNNGVPHVLVFKLLLIFAEAKHQCANLICKMLFCQIICCVLFPNCVF